MLIFSENFKQFVKFFNNSAKFNEQKTALSKTESSAKILTNPKAKNRSTETSENL
jgi:hypothetical protein